MSGRPMGEGGSLTVLKELEAQGQFCMQDTLEYLVGLISKSHDNTDERIECLNIMLGHEVYDFMALDLLAKDYNAKMFTALIRRSWPENMDIRDYLCKNFKDSKHLSEMLSIVNNN